MRKGVRAAENSCHSEREHLGRDRVREVGTEIVSYEGFVESTKAREQLVKEKIVCERYPHSTIKEGP